jgi:hypothetical protein
MYCLRDFLVNGANDILSNKELCAKVMMTLEYTLFGELVTVQLEKFMKDSQDPTKKKKDKKAPVQQRVTFDTVLDELKTSPTHKSVMIRVRIFHENSLTLLFSGSC